MGLPMPQTLNPTSMAQVNRSIPWVIPPHSNCPYKGVYLGVVRTLVFVAVTVAVTGNVSKSAVACC